METIPKECKCPGPVLAPRRERSTPPARESRATAEKGLQLDCHQGLNLDFSWECIIASPQVSQKDGEKRWFCSSADSQQLFLKRTDLRWLLSEQISSEDKYLFIF